MNEFNPATAEKVETFEYMVNRRMEAGDRAAAEFQEKVDAHGVTYAIQWGEDAVVNIEEAALWTSVMISYRKPGTDPVAVLQKHVQQIAHRLLNDWVHESSSSRFSNAVSGARAKAYAKFHEDATDLLVHLTSNS